MSLRVFLGSTSIWIGGLDIKVPPHLMQVATMQSTNSLQNTKKTDEGIDLHFLSTSPLTSFLSVFPPLIMHPHSSLSCWRIGTSISCPSISELQILCPVASNWVKASAPLVLRPLDLNWIILTHFPNSLAWKWTAVRQSSLPNCVS